MQKSSIKMAILIPVLSILVVGVIIMVVVVGRVVSTSTLDLTDRLVEARVNEYTNEFEAISNDAYAVVRSLAPIVDELRLTSENPREDIVMALENVLMSDDKTVAVWTCWEPNALDGRDGEFVNADEYHDETGRFVPYVVRTGSGIVHEPLAGYADPVEGEFYQGAKNSGKPFITDPYEYNAGGTTVNMYSIAIPILNDGAVIGAVGIDVSLEEVLTAMNAGSILEDGYLFVLSPGGLFASHRDSSLLLSDYKSVWLNTFSDNLDPILANGGSFSITGFSDVTNSDMRLLASGLTIGDTGRYWGVCGVVPQKTVERASVTLIWIVIGIGFVLIAVVGLATLLLINNKLRKLPGMTEMARKVAKGDIRFEGLDRDASPTKNEIVLLERSFAEIADSIKEQTEAMSKIADGDYSITVPVRCETDVMNQSINSMIDRTNAAMSEINASTEQVSTGASQIADGAQSLAQGSTEQAATVQQLSASISDISDKTAANAQRAGRAAELAGSIQHSAEKGSRQMENMVSAVNEINQAGQDISRVIKVIDDIAFQTNILALNAAVEAARAGQHGKGFAVVSEEVRNLAAKSAEAAKDTSSLIANSIEKAELGARIATETAASLSEIVTGIEESNKISEEIAASSEEQAIGIKQINDGIEQVAQVVQRNSATSEESAAASEELSGQSAMLKELVAQFKLKDGNETYGNPQISRATQNRGISEIINDGSETGLSLSRGYDSEKY